MGDLDLFGGAAFVNLLGTTTVLASATSAGVAVHSSNMEGRAIAILDAAKANAGVAPTLDVRLQESDDNVTFTDIPGAVFSQATGAAGVVQAIPIDIGRTKKFLAAAYTVGGTSSPSFTFSLHLVGLKKYH